MPEFELANTTLKCLRISKFMRIKFYIFLLAFCTVLMAASAYARPLVIVFEVTPGKGASPMLAQEATSAMKTYFRDSGKVDAVAYDAEAPMIRRAVVESTLNGEDLEKISLPEMRLKVARAIDAAYVAAGNLLLEKDQVTMLISLTDVKTKKVWEQKADCSAAGPDMQATSQNISNAMQSATSQTIAQLVSDAFVGLPVEHVAHPPVRKDPFLDDSPELNAAKRVERADWFFKEGNTARAIYEYRRAVNMEPSSIDIRIKLVKAYVSRELFDYAIDELNRTQGMQPDNQEIPELLVAVYEAKGDTEKAADVYLERARRDPTNIKLRMDVAEVYWRQGRFDDAIDQFKIAIRKDTQNPQPRERLAFLMASRGMLDESRLQLVNLQKLVSKEPEKVTANRYESFQKIFDSQIKNILEQFDTAAKEFGTKNITREEYYDKVKILNPMMSSLTKFMESLSAPDTLSKAHKHRLLGCSLIIQYGMTQQSYLETGREEKKNEADAFLDAGKKELKAASAPKGSES